MRLDGRIKTWNDDRGFGFIATEQGAQEIFVHIKSFRARRGRPLVGQRVSFELDLNLQGKKCARAVDVLRDRQRVVDHTASTAVQRGALTYFAIPAFLAVYALVDTVWRVPPWVAGLYAIASLVAFVVYALDKSAAAAGDRRVSEDTLILLGLIGGWPGAIVAQQTLRHKSSKVAFRSAFWSSVALNVIAFVVALSPMWKVVIGV
jgi:uncharacterized membrane protein YsdA (DUF1294 family)/cold shock CspA family protein